MDEMVTITTEMAAGRQRNITEVINTYSKRLLNFIRQRVSREADAEDILQDVFYQLVETVRPIEQMSGWLFAVARNKITDKYRKKTPELMSDVFDDDEEEGVVLISTRTVRLSEQDCKGLSFDELEMIDGQCRCAARCAGFQLPDAVDGIGHQREQ